MEPLRRVQRALDAYEAIGSAKTTAPQWWRKCWGCGRPGLLPAEEEEGGGEEGEEDAAEQFVTGAQQLVQEGVHETESRGAQQARREEAEAAALPPARLRRCAGCRQARYCSEECQARDWR